MKLRKQRIDLSFSERFRYRRSNFERASNKAGKANNLANHKSFEAWGSSNEGNLSINWYAVNESSNYTVSLTRSKALRHHLFFIFTQRDLTLSFSHLRQNRHWWQNTAKVEMLRIELSYRHSKRHKSYRLWLVNTTKPVLDWAHVWLNRNKAANVRLKPV